MKQTNSILIAPCGINCSICLSYQKEKCFGCRTRGRKTNYCERCFIRNCTVLKEKNMRFCSSRCEFYPCIKLRSLDKRYRTKYGVSMLENLENIKNCGVKKFALREKSKWMCPNCGKMLCVHRAFCIFCGKTLFRNNNNLKTPTTNFL